MYKWDFDVRRDESGSGLGDAGGKHFKDSPVNNMVRETIQNSLDAPRTDSNQKVTVTFELTYIKGQEIPDCQGLQDAIKYCISSKKFVKEKHAKILGKMLDLTKKQRVPLLRIMEEGTLGMEGPCKIGTPFFDYIKSSGTGKDGVNTKGSHGLGKGAPLINSQLNTIFVSSIFNDRSHVMGRTSLSSSVRNEKVYSDTGYWGDNLKDVQYSDTEMPKWLRRDGPGTNICVLGFKAPSNWEQLIVASSLISYFFAYAKGGLEVNVVNEQGDLVYKVDETNVGQYFEDKSILEAVTNSNDLSIREFRLAKNFFIASQQKRYPSQTTHLGQIAFYCLEHNDESDERNIGFIRDEMFITDKVPYMPGIPKKYKPFCLLVDFEDEDGAAKIKAMEPPQHNEIKVTLLEDDDDRVEHEKALRELKKRIEEFLNKWLQKDDWDRGGFKQLDEWLTVEVVDGNKSTDTDPLGERQFTKVGHKIVSPPLPSIEIDGPFIDPDRPKKIQKKRLDFQDFLYFKSGESNAEISFCTNFDGKVELSLEEQGADQSRHLSITSSNLGIINSEKNLLLNVRKGKSLDLNLEIQESGFNAIKIELFETKDAV